MEQEKIPVYVHEGMLARQERTVRRLWILCIIIFIALIGTNAGWIYYESQWQDEVITQEIEQDSGFGGINNYRGIVGGDYYGEAKDKDDSASKG